jgi:hypothetical protein
LSEELYVQRAVSLTRRKDLGVPELRLLVAIAPAETNPLFFAGDLGQRIFQQLFSWTTLGVDVCGRSRVARCPGWEATYLASLRPSTIPQRLWVRGGELRFSKKPKAI